MTSVERSQRRKFSKIILEENFTFRMVAGCCVVLLKQFGADIVRQLNMDTGLYTAQNPYHPNARLPIPQAERGEKIGKNHFSVEISLCKLENFLIHFKS